jgi:hypothetical protein
LGSVLMGGVLEPLSEVVQELLPYFRDIVYDWIEVVEELPHVSYLSSDLWSFDKGEGECCLGDRGL